MSLKRQAEDAYRELRLSQKLRQLGDIRRDPARFVARDQAERAGRAHIKIVAGDAVVVEMSRYDLTSGRIIFPI